MKKIYVVLNDAKQWDGCYNNLKDAKDSCCGEYMVLEVTSIVDSDYVLRYTTRNIQKMV